MKIDLGFTISVINAITTILLLILTITAILIEQLTPAGFWWLLGSLWTLMLFSHWRIIQRFWRNGFWR